MTALDFTRLQLMVDNSSDEKSTLGAPVRTSLRLVDGPQPRPSLGSVADVSEFLRSIGDELGASSDRGRLVARKLAWCVDDACRSPLSIEALDVVLRSVDLNQWPSKPIVALVMSTHSLDEALPSRRTFLRRARDRLLMLGASGVIDTLSDLKELGDESASANTKER
ncbi:MAG: hypothetical protein JNK05_05730 [Myxococcales bacterium]|nr:hypothetical protein [Myxococcales bacterium]